MIVIDLGAGRKPGVFILCIQRGNEWKAEAKMTEQEARNLASECRLRGLTATVKAAA